MKNMKFYDKYYVGFQKNRYKNNEAFRILGFATYVAADKAFEKRKETVDRWRDKEIQPITFDNVPMSGFKICDVVSRHHNDNKKFRIEDPRGFELEIDVYNLMDIINKHTIVNGTIVEPMLWGREDTNNYLISSNSEEYKYHKSEKKIGALAPGMLFKSKSGNVIYRYEGKFAYNLIGYSIGYSIDRKDQHNNHYHDSGLTATTTVSTVHSNKQDKPVFVYSEFLVDENGKTNYTKEHRLDVDPIQIANIVIRKSEIKDLIQIEKTECEFINNFKIQLNIPLSPVVYQYDSKIGDPLVDRTNYDVQSNMSISQNTVPILFANKKESLEVSFTQEEILKIFDAKITYYLNYYNRYGEKYKNYYGTISYKHFNIN